MVHPLRRSRPVLLTALLAVGAAAATTGCAAAAASAAPRASVEVRVDGGSPGPVEVALARVAGGYRASASLAAGETRTFRVPPGWMTVRVPGRCVVPAPAAQRVVVEVRAAACVLR